MFQPQKQRREIFFNEMSRMLKKNFSHNKFMFSIFAVWVTGNVQSFDEP